MPEAETYYASNQAQESKFDHFYENAGRNGEQSKILVGGLSGADGKIEKT